MNGNIQIANTHCLESNQRIFVHVGPPKTGTTTLQDYFACNTATLLQYKTHFLGKVNPKDVKTCVQVPKDFIRPVIQYASQKGLSYLRTEIKNITSQNESVILSDEDFGTVSVPLLNELFANMTQVIPIVVYRRYHEWLLSLYNFHYKPKWYDKKSWNKWDGHTIDAIPTFRAFLNQQDYMTHPTLQLYNKFSRTVEGATGHPSCTQVLNLHEGEIVQEFIALFAGTNESKLFPQPTKSNVNQHLPYSVDMERLALKLVHEGKVDITTPRRQFVSMLHHQLNSLYFYRNTTPPLDCLSEDEENSLLQKTKDAERGLVPDYFGTERGEPMLETGFHKMRDEKAFCNVDLDRMLGEDGWADFLAKSK